MERETIDIQVVNSQTTTKWPLKKFIVSSQFIAWRISIAQPLFEHS